MSSAYYVLVLYCGLYCSISMMNISKRNLIGCILHIVAMEQSGDDEGLGTTEYILIGIGAAILLGILILFICICCVCYVRRRRPKIYSPSKGSVLHCVYVMIASYFITSLH